MKRQQWDLNPRGQSPLDFESNALDHSAILSDIFKYQNKCHSPRTVPEWSPTSVLGTPNGA